MCKFLVLGLPRSRTAWLANFLTYGDQFCYHEGIDGCSSIEEYKMKVKGKGDSNTGLMFFAFEKHFPSTKIIIIDSEIDESVKFGKEVFNLDIANGMELAKKRLDGLNGLHVNLKDINSSLREIWDYVSDKEFDCERAKMLTKLNIQTSNPKDINFNAAMLFRETIDAAI